MGFFNKRSKGFTLVEIIVATAIIGFIAVMATPSVYKTLENGKNRTVLADLRQIADAIELYSLEKNEFPSNLDDLYDDGYIRDERSLVDKWGDGTDQYGYCVPSRAGNGTDGMVYSVGPNGQDQSQCPTNHGGDESNLDLFVVLRVAR